jgi:hypothetical protein
MRPPSTARVSLLLVGSAESGAQVKSSSTPNNRTTAQLQQARSGTVHLILGSPRDARGRVSEGTAWPVLAHQRCRHQRLWRLTFELNAGQVKVCALHQRGERSRHPWRSAGTPSRRPRTARASGLQAADPLQHVLLVTRGKVARASSRITISGCLNALEWRAGWPPNRRRPGLGSA